MVMSRPVDVVDIPQRLAHLRRTAAGYPIPWFVSPTPAGEPDLRVASAPKRRMAIARGLCWVCGTRFGPRHAADGAVVEPYVFVIGPMCVVNRVSADPPSHPVCATYSVAVCPFLNNPERRRREGGLVDLEDPPGVMLTRNPGLVVLWYTRSYATLPTPTGDLVRLGPPARVVWYTVGRRATRQEALDAIDAGAPLLDGACDRDDDPDNSRRILAGEVAAARRLVPDA